MEYTADEIATFYEKTHSISKTAYIYKLSFGKVRKILITKGRVFPPLTQRIMFYQSRGKSLNQIAKLLHLATSTLNGYLPYSKVVYNKINKSENARKIEKWRQKQKNEKG